jgi:hypothetical protein
MPRSQLLSNNPYPELNHPTFTFIPIYLRQILMFFSHLVLSKDILSVRLLDNILKALLSSIISILYLHVIPISFIYPE